MSGRNYNKPPPCPMPPKDCYDPECMGKVAPFINGCAEAIHSGSLEGFETEGWAEGSLIWNADGLGHMEVWSGYCPEPLEGAFVGMTVTLPDGTQVKVSEIDEESCKPVWAPIPPASNLDCAAVLACIIEDPAALTALCEVLAPMLISTSTSARKAKA